MKNLFLISILVFSGCSTYKKSIIYSSVAGGVAGGMAGAALSPDKYSRPHNAVIFGSIGAVVAGLVGHYLYTDDPRNKRLDEMRLEDEAKLKHQKMMDENLNVGPVSINLAFDNKEKYKIPETDLPENLKDKVSHPVVIRHTSPEQTIKKDGHTIYIPAFDIYEHSMEEK